MPKEKIIEIDGIGPIHFRHKKRIKNLNISIRPFEPVVVSVPDAVSFQAAARLILSKTEWIRENLDRRESVEHQRLVYTSDDSIRTRWHTGRLLPVPEALSRIEIRRGIIRIFYPEQLPLTDDFTQRLIRLAVIEAYRIEAKTYLPERMRMLAERHSFRYKSLFIKNLKTRWGSCSMQNNINLNLNLMRLGDDLIDYVILHELLHTRFRNHSRDFWMELQKICPQALLYRRQLKNHSLYDFSS